MGRAIDLDMYEGNAARRIPEGYGTSDYNRTEKTRNNRGDRKESVYERRREPAYDRRREPVRGSRISGSGQNRAAWKEPVYESRAVRRTSAYDNRNRTQGNHSKRARLQKKKKMQQKILGGLCFYFFLAGIIATCWVIIGLFFGKEEKVHAEEAPGWNGEADPDGIYGEEGGSKDIDDGFLLEVTPEIRQECQDLYARQESLLLLVNKEHEIPVSYRQGLRSICKGRLEAADILYEDLCAMLKAGGEAGYDYWIASAYRDREYQQGLVDEDVQKYMSKGYSYEAALEKTYVYTMPAGRSEHETGLALDILCSTNTIMDESQKGEPGNQWLVQHCYEYGFILRYPEDKEDITGIGYEPWHFRYVGKEAAAYLTEKGWTLEEFYEVLESIG